MTFIASKTRVTPEDCDCYSISPLIADVQESGYLQNACPAITPNRWLIIDENYWYCQGARGSTGPGGRSARNSGVHAIQAVELRNSELV